MHTCVCHVIYRYACVQQVVCRRVACRMDAGARAHTNMPRSPSPSLPQAVLDDIKMDFKPAMGSLKDLLQMVCRVPALAARGPRPAAACTLRGADGVA